jgi:hypothetical protein
MKDDQQVQGLQGLRYFEVLQRFNSTEDVIKILEIYLQLHEGKLGAHWLWVAIERITCGENEVGVMEDYGWIRDGLKPK